MFVLNSVKLNQFEQFLVLKGLVSSCLKVSDKVFFKSHERVKDSMSGNAARKKWCVRYVESSLQWLVHSFFLHPIIGVAKCTSKFSVVITGKMTIICALFQP